jgi:hypothetical protein
VIQPKLRIGQPDDSYEQEADRLADAVVGAAAALPVADIQRQRAAVAPLQRKCACGAAASGGECDECVRNETALRRKASHDGPAGEAPGIVRQVLGSPGQPLDPATRTFMETRLGHDFGNVRIHTDARARDSARSLNALAYTVGRDVVFSAGQYAPQASAGRKLLAHELAHVVQQTGGGAEFSIQRMAACPTTLNSSDPVPAGWKPYHGDPCAFHCCYRGILEDRSPTPEDPMNECFYDNGGQLVTATHPYAGCRGTPDQYDSSRDPIRHATIDSGGIVRKGWGAFWSAREHDVELIRCAVRCGATSGMGRLFCMQQCMGNN